MTFTSLLGSNSIVNEKEIPPLVVLTLVAAAQGKRRKDESMDRNPIPFALKVSEETGRYERGPAIKHLDCSFYNECLDTAIAGKWKAFGCRECTAYQALSEDQQVLDLLGLLAARMASENVVKTGKAGRTRGVKPGADAKVRRRKKAG